MNTAISSAAQSHTTAPCPRCDLDAPLRFRVRDVNRRLSDEVFRYYRCPQCRILFLRPIPEDLGRYYASEYHRIPASLEELAAASEPERYKIEIVRKFSQGGRLLEIGPSTGSFAHLAKQAGFEVEAIEMDPDCCEFLNRTVGIRAIHSDDVARAVERVGPYDVVALWHVIEHLPDPWTALRIIAQRIRPCGLIVMAAPNPDAFQYRVLGRRWAHVDAPRHLQLIPAAVLGDELKRLGFTPLLQTTTDEGGLFWNSFGWHHSLYDPARPGAGRRVMRQVARACSRLSRPLERRGLNGSAYTLVYQKEPAR